MMARFIGQLVGATFAVWLFAIIAEKVGLGRSFESSKARVTASTVFVSLAGAILYVFANSSGAPWMGIFYLVGGVIVLPFRLWAAHRKDRSYRDREELSETFN